MGSPCFTVSSKECCIFKPEIYVMLVVAPLIFFNCNVAFRSIV